ncbi:MAG: TVP38/TMEM64 family protein [Acidobacteria bacterium]|nr:TVP38/TMEM64 family protein [Acidobacteriota bacterium]HQZ38676.1 TVP38/TMEM64 family protein [Vicinamibacterales bacterium]
MKTAIKAIAAILGLAALAIVGREVAAQLPRFTAWVASLGPWGPLVFIAGYSIAPVILAPAFLLTLAAGAIFGFVKGVLYVMVGATIGATLAFLSGRYVARQFVEQLLRREPRLLLIDRAVERHGFKIVALLRMSPAVPYVLLSYALGLSRIRLLDYVAASIGMLPVVAAYVYAGKIAGDLASLAAGAAPPKGAWNYALIALGFASTVVVTLVITRIARQAIEQEIRLRDEAAPATER